MLGFVHGKWLEVSGGKAAPYCRGWGDARRVQLEREYVSDDDRSVGHLSASDADVVKRRDRLSCRYDR